MSTNTDVDSGDGDGVDSPEDMAKQAAKQAFERVEGTPDTPFERLGAEGEAINQLIDGLTKAVNNGYPKARTGAILGKFAEEVSSTKTDLKDLLDDSIADAGPETSEPPLDGFLEQELDEIVVSRSTDHNQDTRYSWRFSGGYAIETTASDNGSLHFSPEQFRREIFGVMGRLPDEISETLQNSWVEHICSVIDANKEVTETQGRRSAGVEALGNHIRNSIAYGTLDVTVQRDGVYLPGEDAPKAHQGEIWVSNEAIMQICEDKDLTTARALQLELDARGLTSDEVRGASYSTFVNNSYRTYWRLEADFAEPLEYEEHPKTPAEKAAERMAANEDAADQEPTHTDDHSSDTGMNTSESESTTRETATDGNSTDDTSSGGDGEVLNTSDSISIEMPTDDSPRHRAINPDLRKDYEENTNGTTGETETSDEEETSEQKDTEDEHAAEESSDDDEDEDETNGDERP